MYVCSIIVYTCKELAGFGRAEITFRRSNTPLRFRYSCSIEHYCLSESSMCAQPSLSQVKSRSAELLRSCGMQTYIAAVCVCVCECVEERLLIPCGT